MGTEQKAEDITRLARVIERCAVAESSNLASVNRSYTITLACVLVAARHSIPVGLTKEDFAEVARSLFDSVEDIEGQLREKIANVIPFIRRDAP